MTTYQEPKYKIENNRIINRQDGEPIPEDEPIFILRARDIHAAGAIAYYGRLVKNLQHREAVNTRSGQFSAWAALHNDRMHEPSTEMDAGWTSAGNPPFTTPA